MEGGKKTTAQKIVYGALDIVAKQTEKEPMEIFDLAIRNVSPAVEVKSKRVGGANYQVPRDVRGERKLALAFRWILDAARSKKGKPMAEKLAEEIILASKNEGNAMKKKMDTHRIRLLRISAGKFGKIKNQISKIKMIRRGGCSILITPLTQI